MSLIIDLIIKNEQYIYAASFGITIIIYFIKLITIDFGSDSTLFTIIAFFVSAMPVVNTFLAIWLVCKYIFLFFKKIYDKKKEKKRLENESFKVLYNDLKDSLVVSGHFQNDEEISELVDSIKLSKKLLEN